MNRYSRGPSSGGPSRATASTTCQKCLKKDIYECKAVVQERPYVSRPSRTQQLLNPKLVPKLTNDAPQDLLRKKGIADEHLAKLEEERGRKRNLQSEDEDPDVRSASKRVRSASFASSTSVSTISTNRSQSPSPRSASKNTIGDRDYHARRPYSPPAKGDGRPKPRKRSPSSQYRVQLTDPEKKRQRESFSPTESRTSEDGRYIRPGSRSRERTSSKCTRRKFEDISPVRGRRTASKSPDRGRRRISHDRRREDEWDRPSHRDDRPLPSNSARDDRSAPKDRSLSPFSKRLALTQAMNK